MGLADEHSRFANRNPHEYRFVLVCSVVVLAITSIPFALGATLATEDRAFGGFVYAVEDCYSYLAKMRQGAEGAWLFHIAYTPEPHRGTLFFPFHLLLGKVAALLPGGDGSTDASSALTARMVWVYHGARVVFGLILLVTVYHFLAACTERVVVRRLAWLMVACGGGLGWLLVALGQPNWLGSMPLDFILPEGFTFLVLYSFPHIALARTLLLWGILFLLKAWREHPRSGAQTPHHAPRTTLHVSRFTFHVSRITHHVSRITHHVSRFTSHVSRFTSHVSRFTSHVSRFTFHVSRLPGPKWAALAGLTWLLMGLIVPFYVAVAWAVMGAAWLALGLRERRVPWREGLLAGGVMLVSAPVVAYSAWVFTTDPVYATWAAQNQILSPHPLHYLAAYGIPLSLAALAMREAWDKERLGWLALAWVGFVPALVYLPFNLQRRLVEGVQVPLSLLAALGISSFRWQGPRLRALLGLLLVALSLTNVMLVAGNCLSLRGKPAPIYRDAGEVAALDWLNQQVESDDVVLAAYETGNYLPTRVKARAFVGHGPESVHADEKKRLVAYFFDGATDDAWRRDLLSQYGVDWVFWGPAERTMGDFDPSQAAYLAPVYDAPEYTLFRVEEQ